MPIAGLPEQPYAVVPSRALPFEAPAPFRDPTQSQPGRYAHGACEMHNGAVGADQKITVREYGGGVFEVHRLAHALLSSNKVQPTVDLALFAPRTFLDGDELHISKLAKGEQVFEGKRSSSRVERVFMARISLPMQGDEALSWPALQQGGPPLNSLRLNLQVATAEGGPQLASLQGGQQIQQWQPDRLSSCPATAIELLHNLIEANGISQQRY